MCRDTGEEDRLRLEVDRMSQSSAGASSRHRAATRRPNSPLTVLFHRFGPYHIARLRAAGAQGPLAGIELYAADRMYAWERIEGAEGFQRVTVFQSEITNRQTVKEIVRRIQLALTDIMPCVVAIPGWSSVEALAALDWCMTTGTPTVVMSDTTAWDDRRNFLKEAAKRRLLRLASAGLVGGEPHADYMVQLGMPRERIFLGYDVVDNAHFALGAKEARRLASVMRPQHGLPESYFITLARFIEEKNLVRLLHAFARYRRQAGASAWKLVLLGDGPDKAKLLNTIANLDLNDAVILTGFRQYQELPVYYGLAGALVHASTKDTWGLVVNEAMAARLPVIVSERCGCARDLVRPSVNGFTFNPYDVQHLADLMFFVTQEGCNRLAMGQASGDIISAWSLTTFSDNLWNAVRAALASPKHQWTLADRVLIWALMRRGRRCGGEIQRDKKE